jgi:nitric oxide synthase-interacting protein
LRSKFVKPDGEYKGTKIKEKDVITLQTGSSGFAARDGEKLMTQKHFTLGPGNGRADLRGQHQGPRSVGGLQFWN